MTGIEDFWMKSVLEKNDATKKELCDVLVSVMAGICTGTSDEVPSNDLMLDILMRMQDALNAEEDQHKMKDCSIVKWLPIEAAPKDGTDVIVMYMHIDTQCVHSAYYATESEGYEAGDIGWWSYMCSEVSRTKLDGFMEPTHWIPLPDQPL